MMFFFLEINSSYLISLKNVLNFKLFIENCSFMRIMRIMRIMRGVHIVQQMYNKNCHCLHSHFHDIL
jgi:hypothetical protein